jgi:hypothetical protein
MLCVLPLAYALMRIPISVQGIGVWEGSFSYLLIAGGFSGEAGVSIALLLRAVGVIGCYLPAVVMWWLSPTLIQPSYNISEVAIRILPGGREGCTRGGSGVGPTQSGSTTFTRELLNKKGNPLSR